MWLAHRRLAAPAFLRERIAGYASTMVGEAERTAAAWRDGERIDVHEAMTALTL